LAITRSARGRRGRYRTRTSRYRASFRSRSSSSIVGGTKHRLPGRARTGESGLAVLRGFLTGKKRVNHVHDVEDEGGEPLGRIAVAERQYGGPLVPVLEAIVQPVPPHQVVRRAT